MSPLEIVEALERNDVGVRVIGGRIELTPFEDEPPEWFLEELTRAKAAVIEILRTRPAPALLKVRDRRPDLDGVADAGPQLTVRLVVCNYGEEHPPEQPWERPRVAIAVSRLPIPESDFARLGVPAPAPDPHSLESWNARMCAGTLARTRAFLSRNG